MVSVRKCNLTVGPVSINRPTKYSVRHIRNSTSTESSTNQPTCLGKNPHEHLLAIGKRELAWAQEFGKPQGVDFPHNAFFPEVNSHKDYMVLLEKYLAIAPFLLPKEPSDPQNQTVLRHPGML